MQAGLSTYSFPWAIGVDHHTPSDPLTATSLLEFAAAHDIGRVQFGDNMPLHAFTAQELVNLKKTAGLLNIQVEVGTRRLTVENISRYLTIAQSPDASFLRVVIDDEGHHPSVQQVVDTIKNLLPALKQSRICLAIENHDRFPAATLQSIIEQTDPLLIGICLDTANSLGANEGIMEVLRVLGQYTVNLHVKDITIKRFTSKMGFVIEGCAAGRGILDIPEIIRQLKVYDRCKTVTLELWPPPEASIEQSIAREKQWVEMSIHYLKSILT